MPSGRKAPWKRAALIGAALSLMAGPALAGGTTHARFTAIMNQVFGAGAWRMTGGYRTPERENELRAQGAKTVRPGGVSPHSLGSRSAPGAYDLVVDGMSPYEAAARLRRAGAPFARYVPKGAHGTQGPHLHLEPYSYDLLASGPGGTIVADRSRGDGLPVVLAGVRRSARPDIFADIAAPDDAPEEPSPAAQALARLRTLALGDRPEAQLALGMAYAKGLNTARDLGAARAWLELAANNPKAKDETYKAASAALREVTDQLEVEGALQVRRLARRASGPAEFKPCPVAAPKAGRLPLVVAMSADCGPATPKGRGAGVVVMSGGR